MNVSTLKKWQFVISYRPGTADEAVINESFENDLYLKGAPEYLPKVSHVVLDIGAHIGCFAMLMSSKLQFGKVYAFEPSKDTFCLLDKNIVDNGLKNVIVSSLAVSNRCGIVNLYHDLQTGNWGHSITKALSNEFEVVHTITLEKIFENENLLKVDLVKFNCEGAEFDILLNTPINILSKIETMIVLYHEELVNGLTYKNLVKFLLKAGYRVRHRERDKRSKSGRIVAYRANGTQRISMFLRGLPLDLKLFRKKMCRKFYRLISVLSGKG